MANTRIINEAGPDVLLPSPDGLEHERDLREAGDPEAVELRDNAVPTLVQMISDLRRLIVRGDVEQHQAILAQNPQWKENLFSLRDEIEAIITVSDEDMAAAIADAADATPWAETSEPCAGGAKQRVTQRQCQSATVGYRMIERVHYQEGPDSRRCFAEDGRTREVVAL